jgi:hypothetical protein
MLVEILTDRDTAKNGPKIYLRDWGTGKWLTQTTVLGYPLAPLQESAVFTLDRGRHDGSPSPVNPKFC